MTETDQDALERALVACRAESAARAKQIDSMLIDRPWERVAVFAASCAQSRSLGACAPRLRSAQPHCVKSAIVFSLMISTGQGRTRGRTGMVHRTRLMLLRSSTWCVGAERGPTIA